MTAHRETAHTQSNSAIGAPRLHGRRLALLATGIAGVALLGGCSSHAPRPDKMARASQEALTKGDIAHAVTLAESAVAADGRNPAMRLLLANAYLRGGRFESARTAYSDAIELGDDSARAALGLVLTDLALGRSASALDTINTYGDVLPVADLGLALAMAGQNQRGIGVLTDAIRKGQNTPKVRQNLAYAYALSGMWADAKIMTSQDVPADQVNPRLQAWAAMASPEDGRRRVASLLGTPLIGDTGQPEALALAHFPAAPGAPAEAAPPARAVAAELPPVQADATTGALARIDLPAAKTPEPAAAPVAPVAVAAPAPQRPAKAPVPTRLKFPVRAASAASHGMGTHLVQLGAFNSAESAKRAWQHFVSRNPSLTGHPNMITKVTVRGRDFWRVQAAGFAGQASATSLCGSLRAHGGACLVMALNAAAHVNGVATADGHAAHPAVRPASTPAAKAHPRKTDAAR
ncbi:SPOR domain-containing protein [Novosphingobium sp.]|uniref:SPOR domain-containing protein n=1 Tax=Novosphingobium sp. TaxID=1874826 RepID=UPI003342A4D4